MLVGLKGEGGRRGRGGAELPLLLLVLEEDEDLSLGVLAIEGSIIIIVRCVGFEEVDLGLDGGVGWMDMGIVGWWEIFFLVFGNNGT